MSHTKSYFLSDMSGVYKSQPNYTDKGYSLDIPWNDIYTTGWIYERSNMWGSENKVVTRSDPEYFAPGGLIRSNVIPSINVNDPVYHFDRSDYTFNIQS